MELGDWVQQMCSKKEQQLSFNASFGPRILNLPSSLTLDLVLYYLFTSISSAFVCAMCHILNHHQKHIKVAFYSILLIYTGLLVTTPTMQFCYKNSVDKYLQKEQFIRCIKLKGTKFYFYVKCFHNFRLWCHLLDFNHSCIPT